VPTFSQISTLFVPRWPVWAQSMLEVAIGGLIPAGLFWFVAEVYFRLRHREGLGLGDVKMMLVIGGFLGLPSALATIFLAATAGSIVGLLFVWITKKDLSSYQLPFGSFLAVAAVFLGLFSEHIFSVYWKVLE
jgi:leader peptidase (prepilin peptidase)/N-methyltransferase